MHVIMVWVNSGKKYPIFVLNQLLFSPPKNNHSVTLYYSDGYDVQKHILSLDFKYIFLYSQ